MMPMMKSKQSVWGGFSSNQKQERNLLHAVDGSRHLSSTDFLNKSKLLKSLQKEKKSRN